MKSRGRSGGGGIIQLSRGYEFRIDILLNAQVDEGRTSLPSRFLQLLHY